MQSTFSEIIVRLEAIVRYNESQFPFFPHSEFEPIAARANEALQILRECDKKEVIYAKLHAEEWDEQQRKIDEEDRKLENLQ